MDFEELASLALGALLGHTGGSIEQALDDMGIRSEEERQAIKDWFGWFDDDEFDNDYYDEDEEDIEE